MGDVSELIIPGNEPEEPQTGYKLPEDPANPNPEEWTTCFIIGIDLAGRAHAAHDVEAFVNGKVFNRAASADDMWLGVAQVQRDLEQSSIAQRVLINLQMLTQRMQQEMESAQISQQLRTTPDPFRNR